MSQRRPAECPICGHERIERKQQLITSAERARVRAAAAWSCRLCAYQWAGALVPPGDTRELA